MSDLDWLAPDHRPAPAEALARIRTICQQHPDLFGALFTVQATHQAVPRERLAEAVKACRADTTAFSVQDLAGMLTALTTGGREGFDAVLRSRSKQRRKTAAASWVRD